MKYKKLTFDVWRGLRSAVSAAMAGESGGNFQEEDYPRLQKADAWLEYEGQKRGYFDRLETDAP
jgi:isoleucyl-tRNA synthetase